MNPLVTVVVVTYNSSVFVTETLESVYNQTWREIELIITDDCSTDNTVDICRSWITERGGRFIKCKIIDSDRNTGVAANANRGLRSSNGIWIKYLAGDDALKPSCIEDNMSWVFSHSGVRVLFSRMDVFRETFERKNHFSTIPDEYIDDRSIIAEERSAGSQYKMLLVCDRIHFTPTVFIHTETLRSIGGYDERFKLLEDYPLWLNLTRNGIRLFWMNSVTVNYRQHSKAINNTGNDVIVNQNYFRSEFFRKSYTYPYLPKDKKLEQKFKWYACQVFRIYLFNRNIRANRFLFKLLTVYLNPFRYMIHLRVKLVRQLIENEFYM